MQPDRNILIICYDSYESQPRVLRTIEALQDHFSITAAGYSDASTHKVKFIDLAPNRTKNRQASQWHFNKPAPVRLPVSLYHYVKQAGFHKPLYFEKQYWNPAKKADLNTLQQKHWDLIIAHGLDALPLSIHLSKGKTPVIFNAHEYYPLEFEQDKSWLMNEGAKAKHLIKKYLPRCSYMFCVSSLIEKKYQELIPIRSTVITNAPGYLPLEPQPVDPEKIRIIHHGIAFRERDIEHMATLVEHLDDRYELNLMLTAPDKPYYEELKQKFTGRKNINFLPVVPMNELCSFINRFDIGYYILPPVNFNTTYALPNKLYEFIQARLCLAFAPSPEMKAVIENYQLGVVSEDYTPGAVAKKIKALSAEAIMNFKANCHKHAQELSAGHNRKKILEVVTDLLKN